MPKVSNSDIEQLKSFIQEGFKELKQDISKLDAKIEGLDQKLRDIELAQAETKGRMEEWKSAIQKIPDLSEKFGELKKR